MKSRKILAILVLSLVLMVLPVQAGPVGTAFTYQGRLIDANDTADGQYDFQFELYDSPADGNQLASTIDVNDLDVIDGYFTVELDFGSVFNGNARWLETTVSHADVSDPCTLTPRLELTPTPYALYAETAGGDNDWRVSGDDMYAIPSGTVTVSRLHDAAGPGLEVRRSLPTPGELTRMEIDSTSIDTYLFRFPLTSGATLGLNSKSRGSVILAGGGGNVGIGTSNPLSKLSVGSMGIANVGVYANASNTGVYGRDSDTGSFGRLGNDTYGVYGYGTTYGVYGSGSTYGVYGSGNDAGVHGIDSGSGAYGSLGYGPTGVWGAGSNYGVIGEGTTYGVKGTDSDTGAYGRLGNDTWGGYFSGDGYFSGSVGIGTNIPSAKLEVDGGPIKATGGLIIETRTSDPNSPVTGQIWLRTDIP